MSTEREAIAKLREWVEADQDTLFQHKGHERDYPIWAEGYNLSREHAQAILDSITPEPSVEEQIANLIANGAATPIEIDRPTIREWTVALIGEYSAPTLTEALSLAEQALSDEGE